MPETGVPPRYRAAPLHRFAVPLPIFMGRKDRYSLRCTVSRGT
jgi:hypothetical protein